MFTERKAGEEDIRPQILGHRLAAGILGFQSLLNRWIGQGIHDGLRSSNPDPLHEGGIERHRCNCS